MSSQNWTMQRRMPSSHAEIRIRVTSQTCAGWLYNVRASYNPSSVNMENVRSDMFGFVILYSKVGRTLTGVGTNPGSNMGLAVINLVVCSLPPTSRTDVANKLLAHTEQYKGTWLQ